MTRAEPKPSDGSRASGGKPWESAKGGEGSQADPIAARFVESLSYDTRLYDADIRGSIAHAKMLHSVGLLSHVELADIERGLADIRREIESAPAGPNAVGVPGAWPGWRIELEDVHMCVEAALVAKVGDAGRKLHTGRSRNDQVALDLRLWIRSAIDDLTERLGRLMRAFEGLARRQGDAPLPTYTHLQRAQPACVGAECMAWWAMFERDREFLWGLRDDPFGLAASPLGSGAIAGSSLPLDRDLVARELGFATVTLSSIDATASRDEAMDFLYALSRIGVHLSRFAEQWIIYCSTEFGFISIGSAYTTGSSMMPQKRNPDMLELIRGRCGNLLGSLVALQAICKGLPIGYNRDLQEDKRHVFSAADTAGDCIEMAERIVRSARFNTEPIARGSGVGSLDRGHADATALAEYLVRQGVPFRTAHQIVGSLVRRCDELKAGTLSRLTIEDFAQALRDHGRSPDLIGSDVYQSLGFAGVIRSYVTSGHAGIGPGGYRDWLSRLQPEPQPTNLIAADATSAPKRAVQQPPNSAATPGSEVHPESEDDQHADLFAAVDGGPEAPEVRPLSATDESLIGAYESAGRTLDDLPYTPEFESLFEHAMDRLKSVPTSPGPMSRRQVLRRLQNLRKAGRLPRVGRSTTSPPVIKPEDEAILSSLVVAAVGSLGQRDQLPYDEKFDALVSEFNHLTGMSLSPHDVWRLVAKMAK